MKGSGKVTYTYHGNPFLRSAGVQVQFSQEQLIEIAKCTNDPIYFIENYMQVRNMDAGYVQFKLYDFQKKMVKAFHENRWTTVLCGRQQGKCVFSDTVSTFRHKETGEIVKTTVGQFFEDRKLEQEGFINEK